MSGWRGREREKNVHSLRMDGWMDGWLRGEERRDARGNDLNGRREERG